MAAKPMTRMKQVFKNILHGSKGALLRAGGQTATMHAVTISPAQAQDVLDHCIVRNKRLNRQKKIGEWQVKMERGEWLLANVIVFTDLGELIEGKHRMHGLSSAKIVHAIPFLVQVVPHGKAEAFNDAQDINVPRNLADYLSFRGVPTPYRLAPVLRLVRNSNVSGGNPFQWSEGSREDYLNLYREIGEESFKRMKEAVPKGLAKVLGLEQAMVDWFALQLVMHLDQSDAETFMQLLLDPGDLKHTDAPYVLHERLRELKEYTLTKGKSKDVKLNQCFGLIRGFNAYWHEEKVNKQHLRYKGPKVDWPQIAGVEG